MFPVVVIGAGLAGLTAALHLADRDIPPLVLEADARWPGGRLSGGEMDTFSYDGRDWSFRSSHGVHALWGEYHNTRATFSRYLGTELRLSTGEDWIDRWGREIRIAESGTAVRYSWLPAPFHYLMLLLRPKFWPSITPLDFLSLPGFLVSILMTVGFDPIREARPLRGLLMKEYFRGWTRNLRVTFIGLGRNLLAAPDDSISLASFIAAIRFYTMLRRDSWMMEFLPGNSHDTIIQPMIEQIEARGGRVMPGVEAHTLEPDGEGWRLRVEDKNRGGMRSIRARWVILAVDPPAAQRLLESSPALASRAAALDFPEALPNIAIRLWFDRAPTHGAASGMLTGDFPMDNFFWLHRLYDPFKAWHAETGGSAIETHLYGKGDLFEQTDEALLVLAATEVQRVWPHLQGHFVHGTVRRNLRTQSLFIVPTDAGLQARTPWKGIAACGDWIGHPLPALNMERCCVTGIAAANQVIKANGKETFPVIPPQRPEALAVTLGGIVKGARWVFGPAVRGISRVARWVRTR